MSDEIYASKQELHAALQHCGVLPETLTAVEKGALLTPDGRYWIFARRFHPNSSELPDYGFRGSVFQRAILYDNLLRTLDAEDYEHVLKMTTVTEISMGVDQHGNARAVYSVNGIAYLDAAHLAWTTVETLVSTMYWPQMYVS